MFQFLLWRPMNKMSLSMGEHYFSVRMQIVSFPCIYLVFPSFTRGSRLSSLWCSLLNCIQLLEATVDSLRVAVWFLRSFVNTTAGRTQIRLLFSVWKMCPEIYPFTWNREKNPALLLLTLDFPVVSYLRFCHPSFLMLVLYSLFVSSAAAFT